MIKININEIISATSGQALYFDNKLPLTTEIPTITIDSRQITEGSLFVALKGEYFDGHQFIHQTKEQGAMACLVEQPSNIDFPTILVKDSRQALAQIAHLIRQKSTAKFVALTGSSGKTSVKEMTASILKLKGNTLYTQGNLNNEIGVPLTLFRLEETDEFAVVELGANHQGEIKWTTQIVHPQVALINNITSAHLEGFGSLEGVAKAKAEIFQGLPENGIGLVNLNSLSQDWEKEYFTENKKQLMTFSTEDSNADYFADSINFIEKNNQSITCFRLITPQGEISIELPLLGLHNVSNAIASAALAQLIGASLTQIQEGLAQITPVSGRLFPIQLTKNIMLIDDTYNANLGSMKAALDVLSQQDGIKIFVVGDMGELGEQAADLHTEVGLYTHQKNIDLVLSVGELSQQISKPHQNGQHFTTHSALVDALKKQMQSDQKMTILVKGSRSSKMDEIIKALQVNFLL